MKKHYRVYLNGNHPATEQIALLACKSNFQEGSKKTTIEELENAFKLIPQHIRVGLELNNADTSLTIDEGTNNLLFIEEIDLIELKLNDHE